MAGLLTLALTLVVSYLVGSVPFGYVISHLRGVDIFHAGSGNIGATNVGRVLGKPYGLLVFVLDFAKGALPVVAAIWMSAQLDLGLPPDSLPAAAGLAAFLGHIFPIFLRFHGGKGVATAAGVVTVLLPGPAIGAFLSWLLVVCLTRYVSLASLSAAAVLCVFRIGVTPRPFAEKSLTLTVFCLVAAAMVFLRHGSNIQRLLSGSENRIKESSTIVQLSKSIHLLALGLWFGTVAFFTFVVAPTIFATFEGMALAPPGERPQSLSAHLQKDQATQLAGIVITPLFPWYFLSQGICGLFAVAIALTWARSQPVAAVHRFRFYVLAAALAVVIAAWPLGQKVEALRLARYAADPLVADPARESFGTWHLASLLLNFVVMGLVTAAMIMAAWLPDRVSPIERNARAGSD
jgi:acyl-phosphate glycerol 3-phosphate acyltransferase